MAVTTSVKGIQTGIEKGRLEPLHSTAVRQHERRFEPLSATARAALEPLDAIGLESLLDRVLTARVIADLDL